MTACYAKRSPGERLPALEKLFDAECKLGEYLKATPKHDGGRPGKTGNRAVPVSSPPKLSDLEISKKLSADAQRKAALDERTKACVRVGEITPTVALRDAKEQKREGRCAEPSTIVGKSTFDPTTLPVPAFLT